MGTTGTEFDEFADTAHEGEPSNDALAPERHGLAHVPALDGVRGLAVAAVLLFHAGYLRGGWLGVDLFFVLSGYLITSLLVVEQRETGRIGLRDFWGRRARRLLPALLLVVAAASVYAYLELSPVDLAVARSDGIATLFFAANWHDIAGGVGYWDKGLSPSLFAHTWSLAVEEQLYVIWPLLLAFVLRRHGRRGPTARTVALGAAVVAGLSGALALGLHAAGASQERIYFGTDTRAVAVALGACIAGWRRRPGGPSERSKRVVVMLQPAAVILLGLAWWRLEGSSALTYRGGLVAASVLGAIVVANAADEAGGPLSTVFSLAPLRALGLLSYGLYLWHWPVYVVLSPVRTDLHGPALLALRLAVTLALATVSFFLVERPIRERRPASWWVGGRGTVAAGMALALVVAGLVLATRGGVSYSNADLASGVVRPVGAEGLPTVVVLGDSVAATLAAPAVKDPEAFGLRVVRSTENGCQPVWDGTHRVRGLEGNVTHQDACPPGIADLIRVEQPDAVLVLFGGWQEATYEIDGSWRDACDPDYLTLLRARFDEILTEAGSTGATLIVANGARTTNTLRTDENWDHTRCVNREMEAGAKRAGAKFLDIDGWLCPGGTCRETEDGLILRTDGVHFRGPGGATVSRWLFARVIDLAALKARVVDETSDAEQAMGTVCRSFAMLDKVGRFGLADVLGSAEQRAAFDAAVDVISPELLARLSPSDAAALELLGDPAFHTWIKTVIADLAAGKPLTAIEVPAYVATGLEPAIRHLQTLC